MSNKIVGAAYDDKAALDLAAAFARSGLTAEVFSGHTYRPGKAQAAVYNLNSFFLSPDEEYSAVYNLFASVPADILCYMKSDSSLRGNIGSELRALMDARGKDSLLFIPALPGAQKFTEDGIQYQLLHGENKVLADAKQLISSFRDTPVFTGHAKAAKGVYIADCASQKAFDHLTDQLANSRPSILAGTGALAARLIRVLELPAMAFVMLDGKSGSLRLDSLEWEAEC